MSNLLASIQGGRFRTTIRACATELDLKIYTLEDDIASMLFTRDDGGSQLVFLTLFESTVEFLALTDLSWDSIDEMPDFLSTHLLKANGTTKLGFWAIKKIDDKYHYSVIYNVELNLINSKLFLNAVRSILSQVDDMYHTVRVLADGLA